MKCKAVALRFKVGDSVFAKVDSEYQRGKIISYGMKAIRIVFSWKTVVKCGAP